jgi:hypothetical protein
VDADRERHWQDAAAACEQPLGEWIAGLADHAAAAALDMSRRRDTPAGTLRLGRR